MSEIILDVDTTEGLQKLQQLDQKIDETVAKEKQVIETTEKASRVSFNKVLSIARLGWSAMDQLFQAFGFNLPMQFRLLIQAGFSTISFLVPLLTAESVTPGMQFQAAFGLMEIAAAIAALIQAGVGQAEASRQTAEGARLLYDVGNFLGGIANL